jgi:hypothetical protein
VHHPDPRSLAGLKRAAGLLRGRFGWMLAARIPAYAGTAIIFALYPVLFSRAFGVRPQESAVAFAVVVFLSLPLFLLAGGPNDAEGDAQGALNASRGRAGLVGSVGGGAAAGLWGYAAALGIGAAAVLLGLIILGATQLRGRARPRAYRATSRPTSSGGAGSGSPS